MINEFGHNFGTNNILKNRASHSQSGSPFGRLCSRVKKNYGNETSQNLFI